MLLLAAAMVLGTTFGILNSYLDACAWQKEHVQKKTPPPPAQQFKQPVKNSAQNQPAQTTASTYQTSPSSDSGNVVQLSPVETAEIVEMFHELGYQQSTFSQKVSVYQKSNNLAANGALDNTTLDLALKQLTIQKARALLY
jgi:hypothetical protein